MKRSEINAAIADAQMAFTTHQWLLPPNPRWDVTGFGLGDFKRWGLILLNLAELPEYCEKLMFARQGQTTPLHTHRSKQEDIIARVGTFAIRLYGCDSEKRISRDGGAVRVLVNGTEQSVAPGTTLFITAGERITLYPGVYHEFWPVSAFAIIGEVSTANDDTNDNFFVNPEVGRYEEIDEDEPALVRLVSDK